MARAVLFDMGGTLWHAPEPPDQEEIDRLGGERVAPLLAEWGLAGVAPASFMRALWNEINAGYRDPELREPDVAAMIDAAFAGHGVTLEPARRDEFWKRTYIPARHFGCTLFPDAADTLRAVRARGVRVGVVTNRPHRAEFFRRDLHDYQLAQLVDAVVCSADVGYFKPHAAPFERALEMLGVAPGEAVMVGDSLESDISGAKVLGLTTVWKTALSDDDLMTYEADYTISELAELLMLGLFM